jgi:hypothetical protein
MHMELLGRLATVVGITLALTLLLLVLYQDDTAQAIEQMQPEPAIGQAAAASAQGTP